MMPVDRSAVVANSRSVLRRVADAYAQAIAAQTPLPVPRAELAREMPRLVAVSKTFPAECVAACYETGQRHFGENYLHELQEKAPALAGCLDIRWHYIGRIQSNKIRKICETPGLWCVETLESQKHADALQKACADLQIPQLNVFIQVNTSAESNKGGVELGVVAVSRQVSSDADESIGTEELECLAQHILHNCPNLKFLGLMTIGSLTESRLSAGERNRDFCALIAARRRICAALNIANVQDVELSMGMSNDFEAAIRHGATNVRVGSSIFGARNYAAKN